MKATFLFLTSHLFSFLTSASMCRTLPSPCSSAQSRKKETQPPHTVSFRVTIKCILKNGYSPLSPPQRLNIPHVFLQSGMTVEVLGTVVGTAIQGQIVGMANAPCLPGPGDILANLSNYSLLAGHNSSEPVISLDQTVSKLKNAWQWGGMIAFSTRTTQVKFGTRMLSFLLLFCPHRKRPIWFLPVSSASSTSSAPSSFSAV